MTVLDVVPIVARFGLAAVFLLAGVMKLANGPAIRRNLADFGVPPSWVPALAVVLPAAELVVAAALLPKATAYTGALGALALLIVFIAGIAVNLARGRTPGCACFGQIRPRPVGYSTLVRNGGLAVLAVVVALDTRSARTPDLAGWVVASWADPSVVAAAVVAGVALLGVQTVLLLRVIRQNERVLQHVANMVATGAGVQSVPAAGASPVEPSSAGGLVFGLRVGSVAPDFTLENLLGERVSLASLRATGVPILLLFADPKCGACRGLLPDVVSWQRAFPDAFRLVVVSGGGADENRVKMKAVAPRDVLLQADRAVPDAYGAIGTPAAVLVRADGTIGSRLALAEPEIRALVRRTAVPDPADGPSLAPEFALSDLDARSITSAQLKGKPTLVVFFASDCALCSRMASDLNAWEANPPGQSLQLLVVASGTADEHRRWRLSTPVALDPDGQVRTQYAVLGTPSGALVDSQGYLVKRVSGRSAILRLAGMDPPAADGVEPSHHAPDLKPARHECVTDELMSDGSMVLYNACQQQVFTLNATGALVWECCDGDHSPSGIAAELRDVFPSAETAERDVRAVLDALHQAGMIVMAPQAAAASSRAAAG